MKAFRFSLQKVLEIREKEENEKKKWFGHCHRDYLDSQELLAEMEGYRASCMQDGDILPGHSIHLEERAIFSQYLGVLRNRIEKQKEDVSAREEKMEQAREDWVAKRKEKMILERLKGRREKIYLQEMLREEQMILDDVAITHHRDWLSGGGEKG